MRRGLGEPGPRPAAPRPPHYPARQPLGQRGRTAPGPPRPTEGPRQPQPAPHRALRGSEEDTDRISQPAAPPGALQADKAQRGTHLPAPPPPLPHAGPGHPFKRSCPTRPRCRAPARARHHRPRKRGPAPPRSSATPNMAAERHRPRCPHTAEGGNAGMCTPNMVPGGGWCADFPPPWGRRCVSAGCECGVCRVSVPGVGCPCGGLQSGRADRSCGSKQHGTEVALFV